MFSYLWLFKYYKTFINNRNILLSLLHSYLKYVSVSGYFATIEVLIHFLQHLLAEIFSSGEVHIWTRCKIAGADNIPHCCSRHSFLFLCCQKTNGWFFWSLGDHYSGCCCFIHGLCESLSLSLFFCLTHSLTQKYEISLKEKPPSSFKFWPLSISI